MCIQGCPGKVGEGWPGTREIVSLFCFILVFTLVCSNQPVDWCSYFRCTFFLIVFSYLHRSGSRIYNVKALTFVMCTRAFFMHAFLMKPVAACCCQ